MDAEPIPDLEIVLEGRLSDGMKRSLRSSIQSEVEPVRKRFTKTYLLSAAIILAVTGFGKVPWLLFLNNCLDDPILGDRQPVWLSNMGVDGIAAGVELAIVILICFHPIKWMACLASALWGSLCLIARAFAFTGDGFQCHCLGLIEMPALVVVLVAGWLAVGGWFALRFLRREFMPVQFSSFQKPAAARTIPGILLSVLGTISLLGGLWIVFNRANYSEYQSEIGHGGIQYRPLLLAIGIPLVAVAIIAFTTSATGQLSRQQKPLAPGLPQDPSDDSIDPFEF